MIEARPIGAIEMEDEKGLDDKILAVTVHDPRFNHIKDIRDISQHTLKEITHFFEMYKALEPNKWVKIKGWLRAKEAKEKIKKAIQLYKEKKEIKN